MKHIMLNGQVIPNLDADKVKNKLLNAALHYADAGYSVIPLSINKKPLIKFADLEPLSIAQISAFWRKLPFSNIGLLTRDFFVIDVDTTQAHKNNGLATLSKLIKEYGTDLLKPTLKAFTPSGGYHLYYKKPDNIELTQDISFMSGIDIKAHPHNYVVAPPSFNKDGVCYEWDLSTRNINTPTSKLINLLISKQETKTQTTFNNYNVIPNNSRGAGRYIPMLLHGFGEQGTRNDNAYKMACYLLYSGLNASDTWELLTLTNEHTSEALPEKELYSTFKSAFKREVNK